MPFSPGGRLLVTGADNILRLLETTTGEELRRFAIKDLSGDRNKPEIYVSHFSADGKHLAASAWATKVCNWICGTRGRANSCASADSGGEECAVIFVLLA